MKRLGPHFCLVAMTAVMGGGRCFANPALLFEQPWQWKNERAETVTFEQWRGQPVVLTMFFRSCEARCAPTVERLKKVEDAFVRQGRHPHFVLVTLDPRNDTPARLRMFKKSRRLPDESWHLLSGPLLQTRALSRLLDLRSAGDDGHIEHETKIFFYDGAGTLTRTLRGWRFTDEEATAP
jgi:cytochrome oxidase Cu insertion factor (SCO1/SenC/PrrC family)